MDKPAGKATGARRGGGVLSALGGAEALYRVLVECAPDAVVVLDVEGDCFVDCNRAAEALLSLRRDELLGTDMIGVSAPIQPNGQPSRDAVAEWLQRAVTGECPAFEWLCRSGTNVVIECEVRLVRLPAVGRVLVRGSIVDISERKRVERAFRDSEAYKQAVIDAALDCIVTVNADGRIMEFNPAAEATFGWRRESAVGKALVELIVPERLRAAQLVAMEQQLQTGFGSLRQRRVETTAQRIDGTEFPVEMALVPVHLTADRWVYSVFMRDITVRKRTEAALRLSEHRLRRTLEDQLEYIVRWRPDGTVLFANQSFCRRFGPQSTGVVGGSMFALFSEEDRRATAARIALLTRQQPLVSVERCVKYASGTQQWQVRCCCDILCHSRSVFAQLWTDLGLFDSAGVLVELQSVGIDITERKHVEQALRDAKDVAELAAHARGRFVAVMCHEIRTPLNGVVGMASLLQSTSLSAEQREYVDVIRTSSNALLANVNEVLDFAKIDAGQVTVEERPFALRQCVRESVDVVRGKVVGKAVRLSTSVDDAVPACVIGDALRLRQILVNVIGNAVKFTSEGDVAVCVSTSAVGEDARMIHFVVRDTGIGMDARQLEAIFKPFVQASAATARVYGGTGLGLAICDQLCALMGGSISVTSEVGVGTTVTVSLPLRAGDPDRVPGGGELRSVVTSRGKALRVLVAEDNAVNRQVVLRMLERLGHRVEVVCNGAEALEAMRRSEYEVVLMDVGMPVMDGIETTRRARNDARRACHPYIVGLTASAMPEDRERCLAAGMDDYLSKPVTLESLDEVLARVELARHAVRAPQHA